MANAVEIIIKGVDLTSPAFGGAVKHMNEVGKAAKAMFAVFAAGAALGALASTANAIAANTLEAIKYADETGKMAAQAGMAVDEFSRLSYAASLANVSQEDLVKATRALSTEMVKQGRGAESVTSEILRLSDSFSKADDSAGKTALAVQDLGSRFGQKLIPMLNKGSDALKDEMSEADKFRQVIGPGFAKAASEFEENQKRMQSALKGVWLTAAQDVLPTLNELAEKTLQWVKAGDRIEDIGHKIGFVTNFTLRLGEELTSLPKLFAAVTATGVSAPSLIGEAWAKATEDMKRAREEMAKAADAKGKGPIINADDVLKAENLIEKMYADMDRGGEALRSQERLRFMAKLDEIAKLQVDEATGLAASQVAYQEYQQNLTELKRQGEDIRAELDFQFRQGDITRYMDALNSQANLHREWVAAMQETANTYREIWENSLFNIGASFAHFANTAIKTFSDGFGNAIADIATGTKSVSQAFEDLGKQMLAMLVKWAAQQVINAALATIMQAVLGKAAVAAMAPVLAINTAAATAASIATLGAADSAGASVIPIMAGNAAMAASLFAFGGAAHGGLDFVPDETTYLLNRGERVVSPRQNVRLDAMMDDWESGDGNGPVHIHVHMGSQEIGTFIWDGSRDGTVVLHPRAIRESV